jgi:hypothetical protein
MLFGAGGDGLQTLSHRVAGPKRVERYSTARSGIDSAAAHMGTPY